MLLMSSKCLKSSKKRLKLTVKYTPIQNSGLGTSLAVQWLGLRTSTAGAGHGFDPWSGN